MRVLLFASLAEAVGRRDVELPGETPSTVGELAARVRGEWPVLAGHVFRVAVKPVSSISRAQRTVDLEGNEQTIRTEGRHDACICPRIVPVVEAMACLVIEDHYKRQAALFA